MGTISINGLRMTGHHGVMPQEQRVGNEFEINISLDVPASDSAMTTDALEDTINYADVVSIAKAEMAVPSKLIEHVAGRISRAICQKYGRRIAGGSVTVAKLAPPITAQLSSVSYTYRWQD